jgi:peptidoglycan/LPS O-acetylase OafA/YrhL
MKHLPVLDGVRGLAIVSVIILHFLGNIVPTNTVEKVVAKLSSYGGEGVTLFFVLSGFLISSILLASKSKPAFFKNFYMRRVLRIFPLYYGTLIVGLVLLPSAWLPESLARTREHQVWLWTYGTNIYVALERTWEALPYFSHFWSLAVEEHFYFVWPLLVFYLSEKALVRVALGVMAVALLLRLGLIAAGVGEMPGYVLTPTRADGLCFGGLLAVMARQPAGLVALRRPLFVATVGTAVFAVLGYAVVKAFPAGHFYYVEVRQTGVVLTLGGMLVWALTSKPEAPQVRFFDNPLMRWFGKYSYGLYVFHVMVSWHVIHEKYEARLTEALGSHGLAVVVHSTASLLLSMAVAWLSFHLFEKHFLKLKVRFEAPSAK